MSPPWKNLILESPWGSELGMGPRTCHWKLYEVGSKCGHLGWGKPRHLGDGAGQGPVAAQLFALKSLGLTWRFLESVLDPEGLELSDLRKTLQPWFRQP